MLFFILPCHVLGAALAWDSRFDAIKLFAKAVYEWLVGTFWISSLISFVSKYFSWKFQPCPSFYRFNRFKRFNVWIFPIFFRTRNYNYIVGDHKKARIKGPVYKIRLVLQGLVWKYPPSRRANNTCAVQCICCVFQQYFQQAVKQGAPASFCIFKDANHSDCPRESTCSGGNCEQTIHSSVFSQIHIHPNHFVFVVYF